MNIFKINSGLIKLKNISLLIGFSACTVGPNYKPPKDHVTPNWVSLESNRIDTQKSTVVQWWKLFDDPLLNRYISLAEKNNQDLLSAESNILQARAMRQIAAASFYPQIGADVNATRSYFSKNGPVFALDPTGSVSPTTGLPFSLQAPQTQNLFNVLFDVSWEIDLFGKIRRTVEAADAYIGSAIEKRNEVLISLMAEVARNYMELRGFQKRFELVEENIQLLEKKSFLTEEQYKYGYVSRFDREDALATLASERAKLPDIQAQIYQNIYTLSILIGKTPEYLKSELLAPAILPRGPALVQIGLRSDLLRRRPDIRRVERDLAQATANIGVAVASFFPTFNLLGGGGVQSLELNKLFSPKSKTWDIGADLSMPIFQGGSLVGNLKANCADTARIAHNYQQTVLKALQETESAIVSYTQDLLITKQKRESKDRYKEMVYLSNERNSKGLTSLLNLIDTKLQLNQAEQSLLDSKVKELVDLVFLYKSLGGGWEKAISMSSCESLNKNPKKHK